MTHLGNLPPPPEIPPPKAVPPPKEIPPPGGVRLPEMDTSQSVELKRLQRIDARMAIYGKWFSRLTVGILGLGLTFYCVRHLVEETGANHRDGPGVAHVLVVALFGVLGLCIAGGKRTIDGIVAITAGIRAWRGGPTPPPAEGGTE